MGGQRQPKVVAALITKDMEMWTRLKKTGGLFHGVNIPSATEGTFFLLHFHFLSSRMRSTAPEAPGLLESTND